ncbi:MAG: 16S rRNA (uracil(1498)-N(3))-methyltransferase [Treponema sp.]|jgi:16S rRNA (uracil1498-N3)-methyltransferase|nr:16S rRNA (uracil(1498)-N(3))-methyltransferase [Treponema sp.]
MKQFLLTVAPERGTVILTGDDYHYLARVRRYKEGVVFKSILPDGKEVRLLVQKMDDSRLVCQCLEQEISPIQTLPPITLFQALPKGVKIDLIIRQATEAGVSEIVPFVSEYCALKQDSAGEGRNGRLERWRRIVREARQQSGSNEETKICNVCTVEDMTARWDALKSRHRKPSGLLLHQTPLAEGSFHHALEDCDAVAVLVGPEGGFSEREAVLFMNLGFTPLVMGQSIMRVETASIYAIGAVKTILLEEEKWMKKN